MPFERPTTTVNGGIEQGFRYGSTIREGFSAIFRDGADLPLSAFRLDGFDPAARAVAEATILAIQKAAKSAA